MGFKSPNAAEDHLRALARKGAIELVPGTSRGIRLTRLGVPIISPQVGKEPISSLSEEYILGYAPIEQSFFHAPVDFIVQINTNNYQSLNILSGDYLAVHQGSKPQHGQLVVVRSNQELIIKSYNSELQTQNLTIEGSVLGLIRRFS